MPFAQPRPHDRLRPELGPQAGQRPLRRRDVAPPFPFRQRGLFRLGRRGERLEGEFFDLAGKLRPFEAQPQQFGEPRRVARRPRRAQFVRALAADVQAKRQPQPAGGEAARGEPLDERVEGAAQIEQQPLAVPFRIAELQRFDEPLFGKARLERRPCRAGGEAMETRGGVAVAFVERPFGQLEEGAERPHAQTLQLVAQFRIEPQPRQRHGARRALLRFRIAEDGEFDAGVGGDGVGAVAGEADDDAAGEAEIEHGLADVAPPRAGRAEEAAQPVAVEPEDARLVGGRLDAGGEVAQAAGDPRRRGLDFVRLDDAGAQRAAEGQRRGVALAGEDAAAARGLVDPQHAGQRRVLGDDRRRAVVPRAPQQELQRQRRDVNAAPPAHGESPRAPSPARGACP